MLQFIYATLVQSCHYEHRIPDGVPLHGPPQNRQARCGGSGLPRTLCHAGQLPAACRNDYGYHTSVALSDAGVSPHAHCYEHNPSSYPGDTAPYRAPRSEPYAAT